MSQESALPPRSARLGGKKKRRARRRWLIWSLLAICTATAILAAYYISNIFHEATQALDDVALPELPGMTANRTTVAKEDRAQVKPLAMLLLGVDYRKATGSMNTDVIMVAAMNPKTDTATVVTIPRDSLLEVPGYANSKVNEKYARFLQSARNSKKLQGEAAQIEALEQMRAFLSAYFGIDIRYGVIIDFQGFIDVVDALGGVRVYVDQDMRYVDTADGTNINLRKGEQVLNGKQALDFVRYRKSNNGTRESSDFERNERQARVLRAVFDKLKSLGGIAKLNDIIRAVGENVQTDIPKAQITNLIQTYYDINPSDIRFVHLEGTWKSPYVYVDQESFQRAKQALEEEMRPDGRPAGAEDGAVSAAAAR